MTGERILVVEDNPLNLKLVRDVLDAAGYDVLEATSGEEGLRVAAEHAAGPGAHGPPAARASTAARRCTGCGRTASEPRVPVVAVTAFAMAEDHARAERAGFDALRREADQRARPGPPGAGAPRRGPAMSDRPLTVLAVDDEPANLRLLDAVLTPRGYQLVPATTGHEALDLLVDLDVDLVLLDLMMPGLNGHEVCRRIRSDDRTAFLPVVMITASGPEERLDRTARPARTTSSPSPSTSPSCSRGSPPWPGSSATTTPSRRRPPSWPGGTPSSSGGSPAGVDELERTNRLRHFLGPQLAEVVVADDALLDSHRREIVVVFFDFHGFTSFAETSEPEEVMAVLREYHEVVGTHVVSLGGHAGAVHRRRRDGLLQRPGALRRPR